MHLYNVDITMLIKIIYEDHQYSKKKVDKDFEEIVTGERLTAFEALLLGVILVKKNDAGLKAKGFACLDQFGLIKSDEMVAMTKAGKAFWTVIRRLLNS